MTSWLPHTAVENNKVLDLNRGNQATWIYSLENKTFPAGTTASLVITNSYSQTIATWVGSVSGGKITFDQPAADGDVIPRGSNWQLFATSSGVKRLLAQGVVIRNEAPYPDAPPVSSEYDGARYQYSFGTPGYLTDPAWRILQGQPTIYDNSSRTLPNACSAGSIVGGTLALYGTAAMLWYAPLRTDAVRLTYNTIRSGIYSNGELISVICSNYDMTNWVGFRHRQVWGLGNGGWLGGWSQDDLSVVVGSGPYTYTVKASAPGDTENNSYYTAEYNPVSNKFTLWQGTTQKVQWTDQTNLVNHGLGERYVGFGFKGDVLEAGVQVSDWLIGDAP
jgi:hypothetical protein